MLPNRVSYWWDKKQVFGFTDIASQSTNFIYNISKLIDQKADTQQNYTLNEMFKIKLYWEMSVKLIKANENETKWEMKT